MEHEENQKYGNSNISIAIRDVLSQIQDEKCYFGNVSKGYYGFFILKDGHMERLRPSNEDYTQCVSSLLINSGLVELNHETYKTGGHVFLIHDLTEKGKKELEKLNAKNLLPEDERYCLVSSDNKESFSIVKILAETNKQFIVSNVFSDTVGSVKRVGDFGLHEVSKSHILKVFDAFELDAVRKMKQEMQDEISDTCENIETDIESLRKQIRTLLSSRNTVKEDIIQSHLQHNIEATHNPSKSIH